MDKTSPMTKQTIKRMEKHNQRNSEILIIEKKIELNSRKLV